MRRSNRLAADGGTRRRDAVTPTAAWSRSGASPHAYRLPAARRRAAVVSRPAWAVSQTTEWARRAQQDHAGVRPMHAAALGERARRRPSRHHHLIRMLNRLTRRVARACTLCHGRQGWARLRADLRGEYASRWRARLRSMRCIRPVRAQPRGTAAVRRQCGSIPRRGRWSRIRADAGSEKWRFHMAGTWPPEGAPDPRLAALQRHLDPPATRWRCSMSAQHRPARCVRSVTCAADRHGGANRGGRGARGTRRIQMARRSSRAAGAS